MSRNKFTNLFKPGRIGTLEIRNRIVMPPMGMGYATIDGQATDLMIDYYEQRAKGGAGLIIVEFTAVDSPLGRVMPLEPLISGDEFIPGLTRLTQAIKRHGARAAIQLAHAGREMQRHGNEDLQPVGPSAIASPWGREPRELTPAEIEELVARFAQAAVRAREAGFDGVEIHGAHPYLIAEFLSPASNRRTDDYGGDIRGRARFLCETVKAVKAAAGDGYPVWCRLNGQEFDIQDGLTLDDARQAARMAQDAGCDAVHVSAFGYGAHATVNMPGEAGALVPLADGIKQSVSIPVIAVGAITPQLGESVLRQGKADFIAMGRQLICDPGLPEKIRAGREADVLPCISCLVCIDNFVFGKKIVTCSVNAAAGRDSHDISLGRAAIRKRVLVVGGGPAGMEAARVAATRGHKVTLCEAGERLGGQMALAAVPPNKAAIADYITFLTKQLERLGVDIRLGCGLSADQASDMKPDAVVIATGVKPLVPAIPGLDSAMSGFAVEALAGKIEIGKSVLIIGGGLVGCETAAFLVEKGKTVTVVDILPRLAADAIPYKRAPLLAHLKSAGVSLLAGATPHQASPDGLDLTDASGVRRKISADTILIAGGSRPNTALYDALKGKIPQLYLAGDAQKQGTIQSAAAAGFDIGLTL